MESGSLMFSPIWSYPCCMPDSGDNGNVSPTPIHEYWPYLLICVPNILPSASLPTPCFFKRKSMSLAPPQEQHTHSQSRMSEIHRCVLAITVTTETEFAFFCPCGCLHVSISEPTHVQQLVYRLVTHLDLFFSQNCLNWTLLSLSPVNY